MPREPRITEIDDEDVFQILTEIRERGGKAGVAFHQGIDRTARYPTKKVLAAVRVLADMRETEGPSELAHDLRAMLAELSPDLPIEIEFPEGGALAKESAA
jgi:hypothetical protein